MRPCCHNTEYETGTLKKQHATQIVHTSQYKPSLLVFDGVDIADVSLPAVDEYEKSTFLE